MTFQFKHISTNFPIALVGHFKHRGINARLRFGRVWLGQDYSVTLFSATHPFLCLISDGTSSATSRRVAEIVNLVVAMHDRHLGGIGERLPEDEQFVSNLSGYRYGRAIQ